MKADTFVSRLTECIRESRPTQTQIAEYCDITVQSVGGWMRTGRISKDNLRKLSEITGYRYLWLKTGEGEKRFSSPTENADEYRIAEEDGPYGSSVRTSLESGAMRQLNDSLTFAIANGKLSEKSLSLLADFIASLADSDPKSGR